MGVSRFTFWCKDYCCKWIFKRKLKQDGSIEKYKAHLVAKGFKQRKNVDYFDTFALVTRITSIRVLLALASIHNIYGYTPNVCQDYILEWGFGRENLYGTT